MRRFIYKAGSKIQKLKSVLVWSLRGAGIAALLGAFSIASTQSLEESERYIYELFEVQRDTSSKVYTYSGLSKHSLRLQGDRLIDDYHWNREDNYCGDRISAHTKTISAADIQSISLSHRLESSDVSIGSHGEEVKTRSHLAECAELSARIKTGSTSGLRIELKSDKKISQKLINALVHWASLHGNDSVNKEFDIDHF